MCIHASIWYNIHLYVDTSSCNLHLKTFARFLKYFITWFSVQLFTYIRRISTLEIYTGLGFIMVLDLIRVYLYEVAKIQFKNRVTQGIFGDILLIEPYLRNSNNTNMSIEEFYKLGPPKIVKCDYLFDLWNSEMIENTKFDIKHVSKTNEDDLNLGPEAEQISKETRLFNKRALVKNKSKYNSPYKKHYKYEEIDESLINFIKPETYLFNTKISMKNEINSAKNKKDSDFSDQNLIKAKKDAKTHNSKTKKEHAFHSDQNPFILKTRKSLIDQNVKKEESRGNNNLASSLQVSFSDKKDIESKSNNENLFEIDSDEVVSDEMSEQEENISTQQQYDDEANAWLLINEEVRKATQSQPRRGRITKESLKIHFKDKTDYVYNILTFNRSDVLNYTVFRDNIRQINNERENLYMAIVSNKNLLNKIYYTLIVIEALIIYYIVSKWIDVQPLLLKLCMPIFIVPAWSSIKLIVESFFFIVYSHPYDPGDRIFLDNENYIVRDMSLLTTTLIRWDGYKCIIPNLYIRDKLITNIRRSNAQTWEVNVLISKNTTEAKFKKLKNIFNKCIEQDKAYYDINMFRTEIINSNYINLKIHVKHNYNFQNGFLMWNNHTKFLKVLSAAFTIIGIKYLPMKQEIYIENTII